MRFGRPTPTHAQQIRGNHNPVCCVCGYAWTKEEREKDRLCVTQHMIEKHGFKKVGAQVFQSIPCVACTKPGLYKVGSIAYCKEHLPLAQGRRDYIQRELNRTDGGDREREMKKKDNALAFDRQHHHKNRR